MRALRGSILFGAICIAVLSLPARAFDAIAATVRVFTELICYAFVSAIRLVQTYVRLPAVLDSDPQQLAIAGYNGPVDADVRHESIVRMRSADRGI